MKETPPDWAVVRGQLIKSTYKGRGWTRAHAAREVGCSSQSMHNWETGSPISFEFQAKLARYLGIDPARLAEPGHAAHGEGEGVWQVWARSHNGSSMTREEAASMRAIASAVQAGRLTPAFLDAVLAALRGFLKPSETEGAAAAGDAVDSGAWVPK